MLANDRATAALGMEVADVGPGRAVVRMVVRDDMVNGWGTCHGALVAAVADTAFAVACNSFGEVTVAAGFDITFLAPARAGDWLVATAVRRSTAGRSGIYDVSVTGSDGAGQELVVAEFRGRSRSLGRPIEDDAQA
jgi:acyl-CoA thioesterase